MARLLYKQYLQNILVKEMSLGPIATIQQHRNISARNQLKY